MRDLEAPPIAPELRARVLAAFRKESGGSD
jgi:hypothetical protein